MSESESTERGSAEHGSDERDSDERGSDEVERRERTKLSTHRRALIVGATLPLAIVAAATLLMVSWLPELPDPIAVHWSGAGPDGFGTALPFLLMPLAIVLAYSVFAVAVSWRTTPSGSLIVGQKIALTMSVGLSACLSIGIGGSVEFQRGLADAKDAPGVGALLAIGAAAGLLLAAGAWFLLPPAEDVPHDGTSPKAVDLRGDERLSWSHSARFGKAPLIIMGVTFAAVVGLNVFVVITSPTVPVYSIVIMTVAALVVGSMAWWRVSADRRGFTVRGAIGWPVKRIRLDDIRTVQVVEVQPMRDFGGYGWRWSGGGQSGVILRAGTGIEITASSGKRFVVTVDDAETGAGVIAALLAQQTTSPE